MGYFFPKKESGAVGKTLKLNFSVLLNQYLSYLLEKVNLAIFF